MDSQRGVLNTLLIPFILLSLCFIGLAAFAFWAYGSRQDYKDHTNQKIAAAVTTVKQQTEANDAKQYAKAAKYPLATFTGPASFADIVVQYPKTWSSYVAVEPTSGTPINGYFYPNTVPDIQNPTNTYALRIQLIEQSYSTVMQQFNGSVTGGRLKVAPYTLPKESSAIGSVLSGQIASNKQGTMVVVPILNMTLELWTESSGFQSDFTNLVLPNVTFQS
ncbi:MAG TPA: hypothetical protein VGS08_03690 [Candidatus Saccharimonadales bacterium]|nr:hypothetical protein [Candidatus Saccharimonadales bacterium]